MVGEGFVIGERRKSRATCRGSDAAPDDGVCPVLAACLVRPIVCSELGLPETDAEFLAKSTGLSNDKQVKVSSRAGLSHEEQIVKETNAELDDHVLDYAYTLYLCRAVFDLKVGGRRAKDSLRLQVSLIFPNTASRSRGSDLTDGRRAHINANDQRQS